MDRKISDMSDHIVVCGWGRVGRAVAADLAISGREVVVVDVSAHRLRDADMPTVVGDATLDDTLRDAGIERARALVAALEGDAENLFVTLSSKAINPRASTGTRPKVRRAPHGQTPIARRTSPRLTTFSCRGRGTGRTSPSGPAIW